MPEEPKEQAAPVETAEPKAAKKSALSAYLLYGGIGLVAVTASIFGTLMVLGGPATPGADLAGAADSTLVDSVNAVSHGDKQTASAPTHEPAKSSAPGDMPEFKAVEVDTHSILNDIQANLDFLDYRPEDDVAKAAGVLSKEDSVEAANWLQDEKSKLAAREKALTDREKQLEVLDKKVSQKILKIEQAESAKIQSLAKLYDNMDPRSVAQLVANLDDNTVVAILPRMKQKNASQVLALMPAQRAARLSKQMITIAGN